MSRIQLALDVPDLDVAVDYYTRLFGVAPHKRREGYANFAVEQPPLKLVLFEARDAERTRLNHLGVEVFSTDEVVAATERFEAAGLPVRTHEATLCCHAVQDKVYAADANGEEWEFYAIVDDEPAGTDAETAGACGVDGSCATSTGPAPVAGGLPLLS